MKKQSIEEIIYEKIRQEIAVLINAAENETKNYSAAFSTGTENYSWDESVLFL